MTRHRLLVAACVLWAGTSGCYLFSKSQTYYGLKTAGQKVVFVLDVSGSMEGKNEGSLEGQVMGTAARAGGSAVGGLVGGTVGKFLGRQASSEATKLGGAKRELIPAIQGLHESSSFAVITFGGRVETWGSGMHPASGDNRNQAVLHLKTLEASGGTPAQRALEQAFGFADVSTIFFVSDGRPTDRNADRILARVRELNRSRGLKVFTVGLGDDQDEPFLRALATESGGSYVRK